MSSAKAIFYFGIPSLFIIEKTPSIGKFWAFDQQLKSIPQLKRMMKLDSPRGAGWSRKTWVRFSFTLIFFLFSFPITHLLHPGRMSSNRKAPRKKEWRMEREEIGEKDRQIKSNLLGWL